MSHWFCYYSKYLTDTEENLDARWSVPSVRSQREMGAATVPDVQGTLTECRAPKPNTGWVLLHNFLSLSVNKQGLPQ